MIRDVYVDDVLRERWDSNTRMVTFWDGQGTPTTRPYSDYEDEVADRLAAQRVWWAAKQEFDRAVALTAPDELAAMQSAAFVAEGVTDGDPWRQPQGAHDAYPLDAVVTYGGKTWVNITPANVWAPGVSGWREQVEEGYPEWVAPTGAHDAYNIGDRVTFQGAVYESKINANTWSPAAYPAGWQLIP